MAPDAHNTTCKALHKDHIHYCKAIYMFRVDRPVGMVVCRVDTHQDDTYDISGFQKVERKLTYCRRQ